MMSEAIARHILECVRNEVDVSFKVGRPRVTLKHMDGGLVCDMKYGISLDVVDIDIVEGYIRIELEDGILIGLPFEGASS